MSRTLNKAMLIGNVGKDPDVNFTPTGVKVAVLRLATTESWKDKDGAMQEQTDWHTVVAWRGLADVVEKLVRRGTRLFIEGKIQNRSYEDRDGNKRYVTEIVADNVLVLDARKADASHPASNGEVESTAPQSSASHDDIPF